MRPWMRDARAERVDANLSPSRNDNNVACRSRKRIEEAICGGYPFVLAIFAGISAIEAPSDER